MYYACVIITPAALYGPNQPDFHFGGGHFWLQHGIPAMDWSGGNTDIKRKWCKVSAYPKWPYSIEAALLLCVYQKLQLVYILWKPKSWILQRYIYLKLKMSCCVNRAFDFQKYRGSQIELVSGRNWRGKNDQHRYVFFPPSSKKLWERKAADCHMLLRMIW